MLAAALLALGIASLLAGGATLVRGASRLAASAGVSPLVVGLTVVAFGTSAPELVINTLAAVADESGLAFGNVVGSNIANLGLVLGTSALIAPLAIKGQIILRELPLLMLAMSVLLIMVLDAPLTGTEPLIDRADALILLLLFSIFIYVSIMDIVRQRRDPLVQTAAQVAEQLPLGFDQPRSTTHLDWLQVLAGTVLLAIGGKLTIDNGVSLAGTLGLSTTAVGLAFVAVGTSLPELVTSVIAAFRREPDLSVGNVVGSSIFNALLVLPAGALIAPIQVPVGGAGDIVFSLLLALALLPIFVIGNHFMGRTAGSVLLVSYLAYVIWRTVA